MSTAGGPPIASHAAVLGDPIAHSLSPLLHTAAYDALGLDGWHYHALRCSAADLPGVLSMVRTSRDWVGLSLTRPLKEVAVTLLDEVRTDLAAVNTVVATGGRLVGHNTDVDGISTGLLALGVDVVADGVAVLGAGGTARAALAALVALGVDSASVHVRSPARAAGVAALGERLGLTVVVRGLGEVPAGALVISTLPPGAADGLAASGPLLDVVYDRWPTAYARATRAAGHPIMSGLSVLVGQAEAQVRLFTGRNAPPGVLRSAADAATGVRDEAR